MHEMSLEKQGSEGSLKCKLSEGSPNQIIYINHRSGPVDIYSSEGSPNQIIYINRRSGLVDIYSSEGSPQTNNIYQSSERPN